MRNARPTGDARPASALLGGPEHTAAATWSSAPEPSVEHMMLTPSLLPDQDDLRKRLQPTLQALARTGAIPTLPTAATRALSLARNPDVDAGALCKVLRTDLALTARILRLANSALYARRAPARSIEEAVLFLGVR